MRKTTNKKENKREKLKNPASAFGEAIGKLIEDAIKETIEEIIRPYGLKIQSGKKISDKTGIDFEIDMLILKDNKIVALVDVKYLLYKKHARDKASWVVVAHNRLRASYPEIKRCLVILAGTGWTDNAKKLIYSSCIDVEIIESEILNDIFSKYDTQITWSEKNEKTPRESFEKFQRLSREELEKIKKEIILKSGIGEKLELWLKKYILEVDPIEKLPLSYICQEALRERRRLTDFISGREQGSP
jgi:hypothetical protein